MDYRSIMDGSRKGLAGHLLRFGLWLGSMGYGLGVRIRNHRFDSRRAEIHHAEVPVISVGNITAGGTGKTPMVAAIAKHLRGKDIRVALVSRGYASDETGVNDEARELSESLPDVPHVQNPDRVEACRVAVEELDMQIIVLDDGFQHRRLHRNLDIVLIDATCPFGFGYLLPRGLLREHLTGLQRADVIAISRSGRVTQDERETITARIRDLNPNALLALCDHFPKRLIGHESNMPLESLQGRSVASFAGIGNPQPFFESLRELGANVVATRSLNDHCRFDQETVAGLAKWLSQLKNEHPGLMAVCTHKDLVKLRSTEIGQVPLWGLEIELGFSRGAAEFWNAIDMHLEKP